jgi:Sec-independent protein secretion pathway component TatC
MQFTLRDLLLLMLALSIPLSAWRVFRGYVGPVELLALAAATAGLAYGTLFQRYWLATVSVCVMIGVLVTPADPVSSLAVAVPLLCVCALAFTARKVARRRRRKGNSPE